MHSKVKSVPLHQITPYHIVLFASHLFSNNFKHSTIVNYLSAVSFYLKLKGFPDPVSTFVVQKFLVGAKNLTPKTPLRLPLTLHLLDKLLFVLPRLSISQFEKIMVHATMSLMYFACLRIGEIAISGRATHVLTMQQVKIVVQPPKTPYITVKFKSYKHSQGHQPLLTLKSLPGSFHCPVKALQNYLAIRPDTQNKQLIVVQNGKPLSRTIFKSYLDAALVVANLTNLNINTHSFRIGRTTDMVMGGRHSDSYIQKVGRWSSAAYKKYIRPIVVCPN